MSLAQEKDQKKDQKVTFVTGKGGVGKTSVACAIAERRRQMGRKTLLVELGDQSYLQYLWHQEVGYEPRPLPSGVFVARWDGEQCLREYIKHYLRVEKVVDLFFENQIMKALVQAAPALKELAILGKITSGLRKIGPPLDFEDIIVDAYATGHFKALLKAPQGMAQAIPLGPMAEQSRSIHQVVTDSKLTRVVVVTLPQELPVVETEELREFLQEEIGIQPQLVMNQMLQPPLGKEELQNLTPQLSAGAKEFVEYLLTSLERQRMFVQRLSAQGPSVTSLPMVYTKDTSSFVETLALHLEKLCTF